MSRPRYRFGEFVVSPARRVLLRGGREVPLIPRYLDLLLLLLEKRRVAVARQEIFDQVWSDVVVSDGALSQAVRTLRRTLGDDPREPIYIRTVSRHGYQFVHASVVEESEETPLPPRPAPVAAPLAMASPDPFEAALSQLLGPASPEDRREAAETLHALGTEEALRRLGARPGHEAARALMRETRWDVAGSASVPLLGEPGSMAAIRSLVALRLRMAARQVGKRWAAAAGGGALAGVAAGLIGGTVVLLAPGSTAPTTVPIAYALVGAVIGGLGAAGVGAGLAMAEALARSLRGLALVIFGALGGGTIGTMAHLMGNWTVADLFGRDLSAVGGGFEGLLLGGAAGLGYALSTPRPGGGMATPRGWQRAIVALATGACCALAGVALSLAGHNLGGGSIDLIARTFEGSQIGLEPLSRLMGEPQVGPLTRAVLSAYEGMLFGCGLVLGLTRRLTPS